MPEMTYREFLRLLNPMSAGITEASRVSAGKDYSTLHMTEQSWAIALSHYNVGWNATRN